MRVQDFAAAGFASLALLAATPAPAQTQAQAQTQQDTWPAGMPHPPGDGLSLLLPPGWSLGYLDPSDNTTLTVSGPTGTKVRCLVLISQTHPFNGKTQAEIDRILKAGEYNNAFDGFAAGQTITSRQVRSEVRNGETVLRGTLLVTSPEGRFRFDALYGATPTISYAIGCGGLESDWAPTAAEIEKVVSTFRVLG